MTIRKRIFGLMLATVSLLGANAAIAADYDPPVFEAPADEEYVPVEIGSGWYLRGDVGYAFSGDMDKVTYRTFDPLGGTYSNATFGSSSLDDSISYGIGFGYHFNDYLRADLTLDRFGAAFSGSTTSVTACPGELPGTSCSTEDSAKMRALTTMLNAYVDLGTFSGLTPYLGAGLGISRVKWDALSNQAHCVPGVDACSGVPFSAVEHAGLGDWRLAYGFMAGVAYDVTKNVKLDVGYRYRHINGGDMFSWDAVTAASGATGVQGTDHGFDTHEVKVGLRYDLW